MSLSKKNTYKLKRYLEKNPPEGNSSADINNELFHSIIDNEIDIKEKDAMRQILKKNESKNSRISNDLNEVKNINVLSEEDILYDEFNYLLDE